MTRLLSLFIVLVSFGPSLALSQSSQNLTSKYDHLFKANARAYMPDFDWQWLKAQAIQESSLNPAAVSHANARGIMQVMPGTGKDLARQTGVSGSLFDPSLSIMYGSYYMRQMLHIWRARDRTSLEKLPWAQSSYNCGAGCVIRAQEKANDARDWQDSAPFMPKETRDYPVLIRKHYNELILQSVDIGRPTHTNKTRGNPIDRLIYPGDTPCGKP